MIKKSRTQVRDFFYHSLIKIYSPIRSSIAIDLTLLGYEVGFALSIGKIMFINSCTVGNL